MAMNDVPESAQSQRERILSHLKEGLPITAHRALYSYGVARCAARVHELRKMGWQIEKRMVEVPTRGGGKTRVAEYRLTA